MDGHCSRRLIRLLAALVGLLLIAGALISRVGSQNGAAAVSQTLHGVVGPDFNITLAFDDGSMVTALPAGTYTVVVADFSTDHNFHLSGPGVDLDTGVAAMGSTTWTATFRNNSTYSFQCDVHTDEMSGKFTVGSLAATSAPPSSGTGSSSGSAGQGANRPTGAADALLGTLQASVASTGKLTFTDKGKPVTTLAQGRYKIVVLDKTSKRGFAVRRIGAAAGTSLTGVGFVGTHSVTVSLKIGQWKFYSPSNEAATGVFFRISKS